MAIGFDPRVGSTFHGYRIEETIGRGGMGVVYKAYDVRLKRNVALKLLAPELAEDDRFRERFLAETELAASLEHPNVVPIHDAGELGGQLYLVMRFVEGWDLRTVIADEGALEPARALSVCARLAEALDAAHERGLVHRDVKPSNVLLDRRGHVYLSDFGLSRRLADQASGFDTGTSLGTPTYVSPEEIRGKAVDGRTDQYSLACVLFECLTGSPPYPRGSDAATLFAHLEEPPPTLPKLEHVLEAALAKDRAERYETCGAFVAAASSALGLDAPRRRRWPIAASGVVAVAAVLGVTVLTRDGTPPPPQGTLARIDAASGEVVSTAALSQAPRAVAAGAAGVWAAEHATSRVDRIALRSGDIDITTTAHGTPTDIAAGGSRVAVANGPLDGTVDVLRRSNGAHERLVRLGPDGASRAPVHIAIAEDGTIWAATGDRRVGRVDAVRARLVGPLTIPPPADERADASFSGVAADENAVWVVGDVLQPRLWKIDADTGRLIANRKLPFAPGDVAVGEGAVWITGLLDDKLARVEPTSARVTDVINVELGPAAVAAGSGGVWIANSIAGTVTRVDPKTLDLKTIDVEGVPVDISLSDDVYVAAMTAPSRSSDEAVTLGVLADCEGAQSFFYENSVAGSELALLRRGGVLAGGGPLDGVASASVAGRDVGLVLGCTDGTAPRALAEARRLIELEGVDILVGPSTVAEAFAIQAYAARRPDVTFVNGLSTGQALTLGPGAAPNVFRFGTDAAQWMAGIGAHAYNHLGWRRVVALAEEHPFSFTQNAGFTAEFCSLGGSIVKRIWVPRGTTDVSRYVGALPERGIDGYLVLGQASALVGFIDALPDRKDEPLSRRVVASASLFQVGEAIGPRIAGVVAGVQDPGEGLSTAPAWLQYVEDFDRSFPALAGDASAVWTLSYFNAADAALEALASVDGDLGDDERRFQSALAHTTLNAPQGRLRLDENHQAVGPNYLTPYKTNARGEIDGIRMLRRVDGVEQTFNGYFPSGSPPPGKEIPCRRGDPPPWARR